MQAFQSTRECQDTNCYLALKTETQPDEEAGCQNASSGQTCTHIHAAFFKRP